MSLRLRLLLASLVLLVAGLAAAGAVGYSSLSSFLRQRTDAQADAAVANVRRVVKDLPQSQPITAQGLGAAAPGLWVEVRDASAAPTLTVQGYAWMASPLTPSLGATLPTLRDAGYLGPLARFTVPARENSDVQFRVIAATTGRGDTLVVAASMQEAERTLRRLLMIEVSAAAAIVVLAALVGAWLMRLGLRPLDRMEATAATIAGENLGQRLPGATTKTEIGRLANVLNTMLDRLETAFAERRASEERLRRSEERMRRFASDASHELRTPIAAVRAHAELYQRRGANAGDAVPVMAKIEHEATRLTALVDDLFLLARLDEGRPLASHPVDLGALAEEAADLARTLDGDRRIDVQVVGSVEVDGDRDRLRQVIDNILANVRMHTPTRTAASITVAAVDGRAVIEITDQGPGLRAEDRARVFERFYRADASRTRDSGGAGLGLSIASAIVTAHHGTVHADDRPGGGTVVRVVLPLLDDPR